MVTAAPVTAWLRRDATADLPLELAHIAPVAVADPCPRNDAHFITLAKKLTNALWP